jgi:hypothetical protein
MNKTMGYIIAVLFLVGGAILLVLLLQGKPDTDLTRGPKPAMDQSGQALRHIARDEAGTEPAGFTEPLHSNRPEPVELETKSQEESPDPMVDLLERVSELEVPSEVIHAYLEQNPNNPDAFIAAAIIEGNPEYLKTAAELFPNNPHIQLQIINKDLFPDQREQWIQRFIESDSTNSLPYYFSAMESIEKGDWSSAIEEIKKGNSLDRFDSYWRDAMQNNEELMNSGGYSPIIAKVKGFTNVTFGHLSPLRDMGKKINAEALRLLEQGQVDQAADLALTGQSMARQMSLGEGNALILGELVGIAVEQMMVEILTRPEMPEPIRDEAATTLADIENQRDSIKQMTTDLNQTYGQLDEQTAIRYLDRLKLFGELKAYSWLKTQME